MEELDEPKEPKLLLLPLELEDDEELLELDLASARIGLNARARVTRATLSSEVRDLVIGSPS